MIRSFPKPHPSPRPNPERLFWRKAVTIIAGFRCSEGVVVCADTQETIGTAKRNVPKLRFEPQWAIDVGVPPTPIAAAFCGATNNGAFVDKLVDVAWNEAQQASSLDEACLRIEKSIKHTHQEFGQIYQPGYLPDAELVYGVKMHGKCRLFHALGPVVNEEQKQASGGIGSYMADFLSSRMTPVTIRQLIILAAYVLFQTKEHVDGCGGDSHIAVLPHAGEAKLLTFREVEYFTKMVECADHYLADLILSCSDLDMSEKQIKDSSRLALSLIKVYRKGYKRDLKRWREILKQ